MLLINILSFLPLETILRRISFLNRKLYIVSGDMQLLTQYRNRQQTPGPGSGAPSPLLQMSEEAFSAKFPKPDSDSMHSNYDEQNVYAKQLTTKTAQFYDNTAFSFG